MASPEDAQPHVAHSPRRSASAGSADPPRAEEVDRSVLAELPPELQREIEGQMKLARSSSSSSSSSSSGSGSRSAAASPRKRERQEPDVTYSPGSGYGAAAADHGPEAGDVDQAVLAELPPELRKEIEAQMKLAASASRGGGGAGGSKQQKAGSIASFFGGASAKRSR